MTERLDAKQVIARRAARELRQGDLVNIGIGLPTLVPEFIPAELDVVFHSENGAVGLGKALPTETPDHPVIDAGGQAFTLVDGAACFDSTVSFAIVRGGHLDVAILGAFEVSVQGDLANWMVPGRVAAGMGGGMELAQKARRVVVVSRHCDKKGRSKLVDRCALPLTARRCVDVFVTERAVFRRSGDDGPLSLVSIHPDHSLEALRTTLPPGIDIADPLEPYDGPTTGS